MPYADLARESKKLIAGPEDEQQELAAIYVKRGLDPALASDVATQLMKHDALGVERMRQLLLARLQWVRSSGWQRYKNPKPGRFW